MTFDLEALLTESARRAGQDLKQVLVLTAENSALKARVKALEEELAKKKK
jgi:hypothetical protein